MVYEWKTGSFHKVTAAAAAEVMNRLAEEDRLNAPELVDESRPEDAPLHEEFEWDDSIAAEKYREDQARALIRHLVVRIEVNNTEYPVRQFFMVQPEKKVYEPIVPIIREEDKRAMLLNMAKREMQAFRAKYAVLEELGKVITAIDEFESEVYGA